VRAAAGVAPTAALAAARFEADPLSSAAVPTLVQLLPALQLHLLRSIPGATQCRTFMSAGRTHSSESTWMPLLRADLFNGNWRARTRQLLAAQPVAAIERGCNPGSTFCLQPLGDGCYNPSKSPQGGYPYHEH